ncbi:Sucraseferredoxin-like protein [Limtongia smithiae]|uniref:Sucraseferredoxin-like protein n=1 Tax=Limtongia smithiae TaxID=1125753 RepID=UPI0034CDA115
MGLLKKLGLRDHSSPEVGSVPLPVVPEDGCAFECDTCTTRFPSTVKIERDDPLWGSVKPWRMHLLVATGKSDWTHGMEDEHGMSNTLAHWSPAAKDIGRVLVSNSSLDPPAGYFESTDVEKRATNLLILPSMIEATNVSVGVATEVADAISLLHAQSSTGEAPEIPSEILGATIRDRKHAAVILICSHRTRDKRCGVTAPLLKKELEFNLREHELYRDAGDDRPGGVPIFYVSHVGGHKYAGNVLIYRSNGDGIWMGRVEPKHCKAIVEETVLKGRVYPDYLRGAFKSEW